MMLKTCSICGKIHDINKTCYKGIRKKKTPANTFRNTYEWKEKRKQVKVRDKYLCQVCLSGKYDTNYKYNYTQLEVHHIVPIEDDYSLRLDSDNLITLCNYHHKMAEEGQISKEQLKEMIGSESNDPPHH